MHIKNKHQRQKTKNNNKKHNKTTTTKQTKQQQQKEKKKKIDPSSLNLEQEVSASVLKQDPSIYKFKDNAIYFDKRQHVNCRGNPT